MKKLVFFVLFLFLLAFTPQVFAQDNTFVSIVNPIRGSDFWDLKDQKPETAVLGQIAILKEFNLPATWLIRVDALDNNIINLELSKRSQDEKGLFLEITPSWTDQAKVSYHKSASWHAAGSTFLTGYEIKEREQLIDTAFGKFRDTFGFYPTSVGAWWIDSYSLDYMQKKYGITGALIVADQYSTDNYQIWGQYFGTPYYPVKNNALHPAQNLENKLDIVMLQWAPRDPVNGYGNGVLESTFSVQANDYLDYHGLDINYFSSLVDIYSKQKFNQFGQLVMGLENSYEWNKYVFEYRNQIRILADKDRSGQFEIITMKNFSDWYRKNFPSLSPAHIIIADDPLNSFKKAVWFMDPFYRVGWFVNSDGSVFRDIRQYVDGEEELCFKARCDSVNFATSATRVLDDVSFGHKWVIDSGKISDFKVEKRGEQFVISYRNEAGNLRQIGLLPRDISVDGKILSIDASILNVLKKENLSAKSITSSDIFLKWSVLTVLLRISEFFIFLILAVVLPGFVLAKKSFKKDAPIFLRIFVSTVVGLVVLALLFYITSLLKIKLLIFVYILINVIFFVRFKFYNNLITNLPKIKESLNAILALIILAGTIFQVIPTFRSGLTFGYGMGFWGPNTHDGIWHVALINRLIQSVPPENPIYAGEVLKNYHFFYDLLISATNYISGIPIVDLVFRFYPIIFSLMLGIGSYYLSIIFFRSKIASLFSLYLIYFAGSFGWIVEFLRERHFGGESAFWANQAVSFNLNPPFAISLVIIIAFSQIIFNLSNSSRMRIALAILLAGSLIGFKFYGGVLVMISILFVGLIKKQFTYLLVFIGALVISILIFLPNFEISRSLFILAPFWFVHSMIDSPDRVGWVRITLMREAGLLKHNWYKVLGAEFLSLVLFVAGNLGLRVISLLSFIRIKSIINDEKQLFIFILFLLSFLIPTLFVQSGNPWNTIQFAYYGLYMAALVSGGVLLKVLKFPKYLSMLIICIVFILAPINSVVTANGYLTKFPHAFISAKELDSMQFLSNQPDGVVLTYPYDNKLKQTLMEPWPILAYDSTAYIAAFSKKSSFLADEPQNEILLADYKKRLVASKDFFLKPITQSSKFLQDNHIKYIYIQKIFNVRLDESAEFLDNIFENEEVLIYQVNL